MIQIGYAHRQAPMARRGMVAASHPLATLAGVEVLKGGGNVVDAAIATNAVLAVTQPNFCGVGGDFFCLYHEAATGRVHCYNGAGRSGSRASLEELGRRALSAVPAVGPGSVSVPGVTEAWQVLLGRFGTLPLGRLLEPAIHYAAEGFPLTDIVCQAVRDREALFDDPEWRRIFVPGGACPETGDLFRQPDLARTLTELAADPHLFYRGRVAQAIARRLEQHGYLTAPDLAEHAGEWVEPISTTYRGYTIYETPPPTQGLAALLTLNLLEGFDVASLPVHSAEHLHLLLEMTKLAYADRDRWIADPAHARVPVERLLSKEYARTRREVFDPRKAQAHAWGEADGDTTAFVVADGQGNVLSVIQSLYKGFGAGVVPPGTGVVLQNRGTYFNTDPAHPNVFAPRKRPFHTLLANLVIRDGAPVLGYANMGGDGQAMFHTQVLTNVLDYGMEIQEAIERPRFMYGRLLPGDAADLFRLESRIPAEVVEDLRQRGHNIRVVSDWFTQMGHGHGITFDKGMLRGGADARADGVALGF